MRSGMGTIPDDTMKILVSLFSMMRSRPIRSFFILLLLILGMQTGNAQTVALVLSGGGAKGAAHIGVIRALEEQNVPIDYIVGTSIGAIVGALYAVGYTPDEMEALLDSDEFRQWASGVIPQKYKYYFRKMDPNASWVSLDINPKKKITAVLPTNLIMPFEIDFEFMRLLSPAAAAAHYNFNNLMIPFRCVVSDIDSTQPLVMRDGSLSTAVRASMSIPLVFNPVQYDNKLLFDGGMYNNFPGNVAQEEFHPDVIIGSRVAQRYKNPDPDDVVSQLLTMLMERQSDTITYPNSVMIVPDIPKINLLDFSQTTTLADSGFAAASRKITEIRKLVSREITPQEVDQKRNRFMAKEPPLVFDSIAISGLTKAQAIYVTKSLTKGKQSFTIEELKVHYFKLISEGMIKTIFPSAKYDPEKKKYTLHLDIQKNPNFGIQFGGNLSIGTTNEAFLQLSYRYLWKHALQVFANGYFGRFYNSARIGTRIDFSSRFPWFLSLNYIYNSYNYFKNTTYFFDDQTPSYLMQWESFSYLKAGIPISNNGKVTAAFVNAITSSDYYQTNDFARTDTADQTNFNYIAPEICFELNTLNRKQYADAGVRLAITAAYVNGQEILIPGSHSLNKQEQSFYHDWLVIKATYDNYFDTFGPLKLGFYGTLCISYQPLFANYTSSLLYAPVFQPLP